MTETLERPSPEVSRQPSTLELHTGEADTFDLAMTPTLGPPKPFGPEETHRPARIGYVEIGDKNPAVLTMWGSSLSAGNFDPTKGVIFTPTGTPFHEAVSAGHYVALRPGSAEDPEQRAQIGNNVLSKRLLGSMGDGDTVQLDAGVTAYGSLELRNKGNRGGLRITRCGLPESTPNVKPESTAVERLEVAEEAGEVAVDNSVDTANLSLGDTAAEADWSSATLYGTPQAEAAITKLPPLPTGSSAPVEPMPLPELPQDVPGTQPAAASRPELPPLPTGSSPSAEPTPLPELPPLPTGSSAPVESTPLAELPPLPNDADIAQPLEASPVMAGPDASGSELPAQLYESAAAEELDAAAREASANKQVYEELQARWGVIEGTPKAEILRKLDATQAKAQALYALVSGNNDLRSTVYDFTKLLGASDSDPQRMPHFNFDHVQQAETRLNELMVGLKELLDDDLIMPRYMRDQANQTVNDIARIDGTMRHMLPRQGMMDSDAVNQVYHTLLGAEPVNKAEQISAYLLRDIEAKRAELTSYTEATAVPVQYASAGIAELAQTLRKEHVSDDDVRAAVGSVRRYIEDAIANHVALPSRIIANGDVPRKGGAKQGEITKSRDMVAEMAVDMLRGQFDVANTPQDIVVTSDGTVQEGQHRAAALMMLYGKNWLPVAERAGLKITRK